MKEEKPRISLHIATKDRGAELGMFLISLLNQTFKNWDLVLCDGSKPAPIVQHKFIHDAIVRLKLCGHGFQYIQDDGLGVCEARNKCIKEDQFNNPIICRIDDDSVIEQYYIERLYNIITQGLVKENGEYRLPKEGETPDVKPEEIGGVSGLVPQFGAPEFRRSIEKVKPIISRIDFNDEGEMTHIGDDTGYVYDKKTILPTHHLRSSFIMRRKAAEEIGGYPLFLGATAFREESLFSIKLLMKGYKLFTDTGAIAWHNACPSGGCRAPDYNQRVQMGDFAFRRWCKSMWNKGYLNRTHLEVNK